MGTKRQRIDRVRAVLHDGRPKSKIEKMALRRQIRDLREGHKRGLVWDEEAAEGAVKFFGALRHWKGEWAGQPFILEPWQEEGIVAPLFGWKKADGLRRFGSAFIGLPRKNGKTLLGAGCCLYALIVDREPGAEVYTAATKRDQAMISYKDAFKLASYSPALKEYVEVSKTSIYCDMWDSVLKPLSSDYNTQDGLNSHFILVDELHAHKTGDLYDVLQTSTGARRQPLIMSLTTAGENSFSICKERWDYAEKVLSGVFDNDSFFAYITTVDKGDDWEYPQTWHKANPNLYISKKLAVIKKDYDEAKGLPSKQQKFKRYHLNMWVAEREKFVLPERWRVCAGKESVTELRESLAGRVCYAGLDLSSCLDLTAFVLVFPPVVADEPFKMLCRFWIPRDEMAMKIRHDGVPYDVWEQEGYVEPTEGEVVDYEFVKDRIKTDAEKYEVREIAFDRWGSPSIASSLMDDGFTMAQFGQGYASMSPPMKDFEVMLKGRKFAHGNNPILTWNALSVEADQDPAGNIKPKKPDRRKSKNRIDGFVAMLMGLARATVGQGAPKKSVYEDRGLRVL